MSGESSKSAQKGKSSLSCAECRRSKLKCDRVFPCQSCIKRGCAAICPDGELEATKGNKVLSLRVQQLDNQVKTQSARIRELEKALVAARSSSAPSSAGSPESNDVLSVPDPDEFETQKATILVGSLSMDDDGRARFYGETACPHNLFYLLARNHEHELPKSVNSPQLDSRLTEGVIEAANTFPLGPLRSASQTFQYAHLLPPYEDMIRIMDLYYQYCSFAFDAYPKVDLLKTVVDIVYTIHAMPMPEVIHPHRMAAFLVILAIGASFDPDSAWRARAGFYETLARAVFTIDPLLGSSTVSSVQALYLFIQYSHIADGSRTGNDFRWTLLGIGVRVAHSIGLHRSSELWKLDNEEAERRRRAFWEFFFWETYASLLVGRPPCLDLRNVDTRFPQDLEATRAPDGTIECSFHDWKFRWGTTILPLLTNVLLAGRMPEYSTILEMDKRMRQFPVPKHLQVPGLNDGDPTTALWSSDPNLAMQQFTLLCLREWNFLHLHRAFCMWAIRENPDHPLQTRYAPSVLATYRSAFRCVCRLQSLFNTHYDRASRFWLFEAAAFSSCVALAALITGSPKCTLSRSAMEQLDLNAMLFGRFQTARSHSDITESVDRLRKRARLALDSQRTASPTDDVVTKFAEVDELEVLGGCTTLINLARRPGPASSDGTPDSGIAFDDWSSSSSFSAFPSMNTSSSSQIATQSQSGGMGYAGVPAMDASGSGSGNLGWSNAQNSYPSGPLQFASVGQANLFAPVDVSTMFWEPAGDAPPSSVPYRMPQLDLYAGLFKDWDAIAQNQQRQQFQQPQQAHERQPSVTSIPGRVPDSFVSDPAVRFTTLF